MTRTMRIEALSLVIPVTVRHAEIRRFISDDVYKENDIQHSSFIIKKTPEERKNAMGKIIAVVSGKGGTGKTSFAANTGLALAHMGYQVLCLDCDITLRNLDLALGLSDRTLMDFSDVAAGRCSLQEALVQHSIEENLFLLAAPLVTGDLAVTAAEMADLGREIRDTFDFCLVDSPAGLGQGFRLAADLADRAVVITTTDTSALRDAQRTVMELYRFPEGCVHLVVNRVRRRELKQLHTTIDDAIDTSGAPLLGIVPEDRDLPYCLNQGIILRQYSYYAAQAYDHIAKRLAGETAPLMKISR